MAGRHRDGDGVQPDPDPAIADAWPVGRCLSSMSDRIVRHAATPLTTWIDRASSERLMPSPKSVL